MYYENDTLNPDCALRISPRTALLAIPLAILVLLGCDGALHWDEPGYLYAAIYQDFGEILRGEVQPSELSWFTLGKPLHLLIIHAIHQLTGDPTVTAFVVAGLYTLLMLGSLVLCGIIVCTVMPDRRAFVLAGVVIAAFSPVVADLMFKTLPEIPAFFCACLGSLAILRAAGGRSWIWAVLGAFALAMTALTKAPMLIAPVSLVIAHLCVPVGPVPRGRLLLSGVVIGALSGALALGVIQGLGIGLDRFLGNDTLFAKEVPLIAKLMHFAIAFGFVWLVLPLSMGSARRRGLAFLWMWFVLATAPFLVLFQHVEPRYLVGSVLPLAGLATLSAEVVWTKLANRAIPVLALGFVLGLGLHKLALAVMPHEVNVFDLRRLVAKIEAHSVDDDYAIVTSSLYTDFHILRVLWPELDVYDADGTLHVVSRSGQAPEELADAYLDGREVASARALSQIPQPVYYFGFERTFALENMALILGTISAGLGDKLRSSFDHKSHLRSTWVWQREQIELQRIGRAGHYRAFHVAIPD